MADVVNVKDFGAVGDGVTDDTAAFQAATSASPTQSSYVPSGTYYISGVVDGKFHSNGDVTIVNGRVNFIEDLSIIKNKRNNDIPAPIFAGVARYAGIANYKVTPIDSELFRYKAFPFFWIGKNNLHAFSWSSGLTHGSSEYTMYAIMNPDTHEFEKGIFRDGTTYNTAWLEPYLAEGEYVNFRSIYTVIRESGVLNVYVNSTINVNGDTYAFWGTPIFYNNEWYVTAYRTAGTPSYFRSALFKSVDNMKTWSFVSLIASNSARTYNETGILNTSGSNFIAVVREDTTGTRDLYYVTSNDGGNNWNPSPGTLLTPILGDVKGTQPSLLKLSNGHVMLVAGKRTGSSGILDDGGMASNGENVTGVMYWTSPNNGSTWSNGVQLAPSWSTDCGNPSVKQLENGNVAVIFYTALGATNGTIGVEPSIIYVEFDPISTINS